MNSELTAKICINVLDSSDSEMMQLSLSACEGLVFASVFLL